MNQSQIVICPVKPAASPPAKRSRRNRIVAAAATAVALYLRLSGEERTVLGQPVAYAEALPGTWQRVNPVFASANDVDRDLVSLVFTHVYLDAVPVMRVYIVGLVVVVVELATLLQLLRQGLFNATLNAAMLCASVAVSWTAGAHLGLAGAAAGSVVALYADRVVTLRRIAALTGVPVLRQQATCPLTLGCLRGLRRLPPAKQACDAGKQFVLGVRFTEEGIGAHFRRTPLMLLGQARGDDDDRHLRRPAIGAQGARKLESVHARHLEVDHEQVR